MAKPTVYFDTNIIGALWYDGADVSALARRLATRDWWEEEREHFLVYASSLVELERAAGEYDEARARIGEPVSCCGRDP
jgi:hypothetical protein